MPAAKRAPAPPAPPAFLITCEHGGNTVPREYASLFRNARAILKTHRGYDPGALPLARRIARSLRAPLIYSTTTRLLVDLNRSLDNASLLSRYSSPLDNAARARLLADYYTPYRREVEQAIADLLREHDQVIHLSIHTFTPVLRGVRRTIDVGFLFDPARAPERQFCDRWAASLRATAPHLRVAHNKPYKGTDDGFTTHLRTLHPPSRYLGIELEVNQRFPRRTGAAWIGLQRQLCMSLSASMSAK